MKCPICNVNLLMTDKHGVEIDYCPDCRGIWLDRGELEKLVERMAALERGAVAQPVRHEERPAHYSSGHGEHDKHGYRHDEHDKHGYGHGRQESVWHKMFDF